MSKNLISEEIIPVRKLFYNNSFGIYAAMPTDNTTSLKLNSYGNVTIKGKFQELILDVPYKVELEEVQDKNYGLGYQVHSIYRDVPKTVNEQRDFLYSILTDLQVSAIYDAYPDQNVIEMFKNDTLDYSKIKGIGKVVYERIRKKVLDNIEWQDMFAQLGKYGIKFDTLKVLIDMYGTSESAIQRVKDNPYVLTMVSGIGFKKADEIAKNMGITDDSPFRIRAAIRHVIGEEEKKGHTYILKNDLINGTIELLMLQEELIKEQIELTEKLYIDEDVEKIALLKTYNSEYEVAKMLIERQKNSTIINFDLEPFFIEQEKELSIELNTDFKLEIEQKDFFYRFLRNNVNFLIGSAGCGKSLLQKILIRLVKRLNDEGHNIEVENVNYSPSASYSNEKHLNRETYYTYSLLAPTGRAAKVLSQYVDGEEASTIHRAIGFGKKENDEIKATYELKEDFLITDESGMIDIELENMFLRKITNKNSKLVFIGDASQIPSIGAGNFLKDCIDSGVFPVTVLDKVFRQSEGGMLDIVTKIRKGEKFINDDFVGEKKFGNDTILRSVDQIHMEKGYQYYYKMLLKTYKPEDIMVLSYTKKGTLGTVLMNKHIQSIVNPFDESKKELKYHDDCIFRVDDYVMNIQNTYETHDIQGRLVDIMNGDSGVIIDIVKESDIKDKMVDDENIYSEDRLNDEGEDIGIKHLIGIYVQFDFGVVAIPFENVGNLMHSWSLTKHKVQGGSCKAGIVIVDRAHKFNSNANLVYTGASRCKEKLIFLCQASSLNFVLRKFENMNRRTFLCKMLIDINKEYESA